MVLTRHHVQAVLAAYLDGSLDEDDCESWAFALECRDDVGFEPGFEQLLKEFLFEVATPELEGRLSRAAGGPVVEPAGPPGTRVEVMVRYRMYAFYRAQILAMFGLFAVIAVGFVTAAAMSNAPLLVFAALWVATLLWNGYWFAAAVGVRPRARW